MNKKYGIKISRIGNSNKDFGVIENISEDKELVISLIKKLKDSYVMPIENLEYKIISQNN